jgi:hypothetical protein
LEPVPFDRGPGLEVQVGVFVVNDPNDVQIPLVRLQVVQSADDVEFGRPAFSGSHGPFEDLLVAHHVAAGGLQIGPEGAELAPVDADVRRVQVGVDVVIRGVAVLPFADGVGQLTEGEEIRFAFEGEAVVERQALVRVNFVADSVEGRHGISSSLLNA